MSDLTRRRALLAVASGAVALAGCAGEDDRPTIDRRNREQAIEGYDVRSVRNLDGAVLFGRGEEVPTVTDDERSRRARAARSVVVSEEGIEELAFGDVPEAERLRSFVTATDFGTSSLYLFAMPVEACYEIHLRSVAVERDELERDDLHPHADFCRSRRPADIECRTDETHTVGFAIRLPVAAEQSMGSGRGMSSSCRPSPRGEPFDATVTPAGRGAE
jgi:hypothetical protein